MAIVSVTLLSDRTYNITKDGREAHDDYRIISDIANESGVVVRFAVDPDTNLAVPQRGQAYPNDNGLRVHDVKIKQGDIDNREIWTAGIDYKTGDPQNVAESPLDRPAIVSWDDAETTEPVYTDRNDEPIINSSGETYDPPVQRPFWDLMITVQRNVASHNPIAALAYRGTVNSSSFQIRGWTINPQKALLIGWSATEQFENNVYYAAETIRIACRGDGWKRNLLDQGYLELNGGNEAQVILDAQGMPLNQPVKLDGFGHRLAEGQPAVFKAYELFGYKDFNDIGLPA